MATLSVSNVGVPLLPSRKRLCCCGHLSLYYFGLSWTANCDMPKWRRGWMDSRHAGASVNVFNIRNRDDLCPSRCIIEIATVTFLTFSFLKLMFRQGGMWISHPSRRTGLSIHSLKYKGPPKGSSKVSGSIVPMKTAKLEKQLRCRDEQNSCCENFLQTLSTNLLSTLSSWPRIYFLSRL